MDMTKGYRIGYYETQHLMHTVSFSLPIKLSNSAN